MEPKVIFDLPAAKDVADAIDDAADLIEERGWCQGAAMNVRGEFCMVGAIHYAVYGGWKYVSEKSSKYADYASNSAKVKAAWSQIFKFLPDMKGNRPRRHRIIKYNDAAGRTKQEVLDVLRAAAKDARG